MSRESTLEISLRTTRNEAGQFGTKGDVVPPLLSEQERGGGGKAGFPGDSRRGSVNGFANGTGGSGTSANEIRDSRRPSAASSTGTSSSTRSLGSVWRAIKSRTTSGSTTATTPESTPTMSKIKTFLSSAGRPTTSTSTSREQTTDPRSSAIAEVTSAERAPNARRRPATSAGGGAAGDRARSFFGAATSGQTTGGSISGPPRLGSVRASDHALDGTEQKWKNPFANARPSTSAGSQTLSSSRSFMRRRSTQPDTSFTSNNLAAPSAQSTTSTRRPSAATGAPGPPGLVRALSFSTMKSSRTPSQPHDGKEELTERLPLRLKSITSVRNLRPGSSRKRDEEVKERSGRPRVSRLPSLAGSVPIEAAAARSAGESLRSPFVRSLASLTYCSASSQTQPLFQPHRLLLQRRPLSLLRPLLSQPENTSARNRASRPFAPSSDTLPHRTSLPQMSAMRKTRSRTRSWRAGSWADRGRVALGTRVLKGSRRTRRGGYWQTGTAKALREEERAGLGEAAPRTTRTSSTLRRRRQLSSILLLRLVPPAFRSLLPCEGFPSARSDAHRLVFVVRRQLLTSDLAVPVVRPTPRAPSTCSSSLQQTKDATPRRLFRCASLRWPETTRSSSRPPLRRRTARHRSLRLMEIDASLPAGRPPPRRTSASAARKA